MTDMLGSIRAQMLHDKMANAPSPFPMEATLVLTVKEWGEHVTLFVRINSDEPAGVNVTRFIEEKQRYDEGHERFYPYTSILYIERRTPTEMKEAVEHGD